MGSTVRYTPGKIPKLIGEGGLAITTTSRQHEENVKKIIRCIIIHTAPEVEFYTPRARKDSQVAFKVPDGTRQARDVNEFPAMRKQWRDTTRGAPRRKGNTNAFIVKIGNENDK